MQEILIEETPRGVQRINRINYEICVLQALRDRLRCKEIWVEGADRFRHPDDDLPSDFSARRGAYYAALKQPMDAGQFIGGVQQTMAQALSRLDVSLPDNPKVRLRAYGKNRLVVTPLEAQAEPAQLQRLKAEMDRRWSMTSLLDVLKETDFRVGFTGAFKSLGTGKSSAARICNTVSCCASTVSEPTWASNAWCQAAAALPTGNFFTRGIALSKRMPCAKPSGAW